MTSPFFFQVHDFDVATDLSHSGFESVPAFVLYKRAEIATAI